MTKRDSNILKCLAIILMLCHHLFMYVNWPGFYTLAYGPLFSTPELLAHFGKMGNACVSIFVFVTAYGTSVSYRHRDMQDGYALMEKSTERLIKLLVNFQFVYIIAFALYGDRIEKQDMAYAVLVSEVLPLPLVGFFGAVLLGAVLSTFDSALNSASTMFCLNWYKPMINPKISDKNLVKVGKIFGTVLVVFSILIAPHIAKAPEGLYVFMRSIMGFFNIPILAVVLVGFLSRKIPPIGAKIAIAFFMICYALYKFVLDIQVHYLHVYGILFVGCCIIMYVSGKIAPMEKAYEDYDAKAVDLTPWVWANAVSAFLICTTIYVYVLFSKIGIIYQGEEYGGRFAVITAIYLVVTLSIMYLIKKRDAKKIAQTSKAQ